MSHTICGIILPGAFSEEAAQRRGLRGVPLGHGVTLFHIDYRFAAYWQKKLGVEGELAGPAPEHGLFPREAVLAALTSEITGTEEPLFAVILTDYFGGMGEQHARVYRGRRLADTSIVRISPALAYLGVAREGELDEFDTLGLARHRSQPGYLQAYYDLAEEPGA